MTVSHSSGVGALPIHSSLPGPERRKEFSVYCYLLPTFAGIVQLTSTVTNQAPGPGIVVVLVLVLCLIVSEHLGVVEIVQRWFWVYMR